MIEIVVVDDDSIDNSIAVAKDFGCKVAENGEKSIERGKSIGLENASNELILFLDADNILPDKFWLSDLTRAYLTNPDCFGAQTLYFQYRRDDSLVNRYCELFGIGDPVVFYLKKQDKLMWIEPKWKFDGNIIKENDRYYILEFDVNSLPTIGSQGFLTKKELLQCVSWKPYLYHMDSQMELILRNGNKGRYVLMKRAVIHNYCRTVIQMIGKLRRNMNLFYKHNEIRKYRYDLSPSKTILVAISMVTFIRPLYDSFCGYLKKRDIAWFLHPILSFLVPIMYGYITIKHKLMLGDGK